jgi:hypothetical protein
MNLPRIEANLTRLGLSNLLKDLLAGQVAEAVEMNFGSLKVAKTVQRLMYNWFTFHPEIKSQVGIRLKEGTGTLEIVLKAGPERRGRRHIL